MSDAFDLLSYLGKPGYCVRDLDRSTHFNDENGEDSLLTRQAVCELPSEERNDSFM